MKPISRQLFAGSAALLLGATSALAQFTPGRVVVLQATNSANGGGGTLVEFTSAGPSGYTVTLPYNATDNGTSIVFGNNSTLNHDMSLSGDGALLIVGGFANPATGVDSSSGTASPRVAATVKYDGTYARAFSSTTVLSGTSIRSMTSDGFGNFWGNGNTATIYLNSNTTIQTTPSRVHAAFNGKLYYTTAAGAFELPGFPTTATAGTLILPSASMSGTTTPSGYAFPPNPVAGSVAYLVDYNGTPSAGIGHFHFDSGGSWIWDYNLLLASGKPQHLAVDYSGATPVLYVTPTAAAGNSLFKIMDPGPDAASAVQTTIGTAPAGTVFRGVAMAPRQPALPAFTAQPTHQTNNYGGTIVFGPVDATGANPNGWTWKKGSTTLTNGTTPSGSIISGANSTTLTIGNISGADAGTYFAVAANNGGSVNSSGALLALAGSSITTQLVSRTNAAGTDASFHVVSGGPSPLTFAWTHDNNPIGDGPSGFGGIISGSASDTLAITGVQDGDAGSYTVTVTDNSTAQSSSTATLTVVDPPQISQQPANLNRATAASGSFTVQATGGVLSYQWFHGAVTLTNGPSGFGSTIGGATSSSITLTGIQLGDAGNYTVTVTNLAGTMTSDPATLTVGQAPIVTSILNSTNTPGSTALLSVTAGGTGPFTYTWKRDGNTLSDDGHFSGTDTATLAIASVDGNDARPYVVTVHNAYGNATATATMYLVTAPFEGTTTPGLIVYDRFDYPVQPYPGFPAPAGFINQWENVISTYNRITGAPVFWLRVGGPYSTIETGFLRDPSHSTAGQYPWPGIDCSSSNQWYWSSAPNNNHLKFGGVAQSDGAAYFSCILQIDQGSALNSGGADVIAGFTSGDSINAGANADNWMYKLCTLADGSGGDGYYLGVFKGDGINIAANGQWASTKHLNRGQIHFIVGCYRYNSGTNLVGGSFTNDDVVSLWIDPDRSAFGSSELNLPVPDAGGVLTNWSTNAIISEFGLRGAIPPASKRMTDLRIGKTWASVTAPYYPTLKISTTATDNSVTWPTKDSGYVLQTTSDLAAGPWTNIDPPYSIDGTGTNNIATQGSDTQAFFRLYYPPR